MVDDLAGGSAGPVLGRIHAAEPAEEPAGRGRAEQPCARRQAQQQPPKPGVSRRMPCIPERIGATRQAVLTASTRALGRVGPPSAAKLEHSVKCSRTDGPAPHRTLFAADVPVRYRVPSARHVAHAPPSEPRQGLPLLERVYHDGVRRGIQSAHTPAGAPDDGLPAVDGGTGAPAADCGAAAADKSALPAAAATCATTSTAEHHPVESVPAADILRLFTTAPEPSPILGGAAGCGDRLAARRQQS
jgi:hypothetical protein